MEKNISKEAVTSKMIIMVTVQTSGCFRIQFSYNVVPVAAEATYEWGGGQTQGVWGTEVPQKLKVFRKICTKFGQI